MLLGLTATIVATCFCLSPEPAPVPEQIPVAPDALTTPIHAAVPADAIPERCLTSRAWSQPTAACPRMPVDPFIHVGARPHIPYRVR
jgi:hypothetical protein